MGLIVWVQIRSPGERIGDSFIVETERIVPSHLPGIVLKKRSNVGCLNTPGASAVIRADSQSVIEVIDRLGKLLTITRGSARAGNGIHDRADGPCTPLAFTPEFHIQIPARTHIVGKQCGSRLAN